jgi:hypothetical protein
MHTPASDLDPIDALEIADGDVAVNVDGNPSMQRGDERIVEDDVTGRAAPDRAVRLGSGRRDAVTRPHAVVAAEHLDDHHGVHRIASR